MANNLKNENLVSTVGQSLLAIGLYTVAFESMVLSFRSSLFEYLKANDPDSLTLFSESCDTVFKTFKFCFPKLKDFGVIESKDADALQEMRRRRNQFAHEGYNEVMNLTVADVENDVNFMHGITRNVERWKQLIQPVSEMRTSKPFSISPAIFGLYLAVAKEISISKLSIEGETEDVKRSN